VPDGGAERNDAVLKQELVVRSGIRSSSLATLNTQLGAPHERDKRPSVNPMVLWAEYRESHRPRVIPRLRAQNNSQTLSLSAAS
jgi:hypothetical protein